MSGQRTDNLSERKKERANLLAARNAAGVPRDLGVVRVVDEPSLALGLESFEKQRTALHEEG